MASDEVDARVERTRRLLCEAVLAMVRESGTMPSVSALCRRAGISRSTFYQHFDAPEAVLVTAVEHIWRHADLPVDLGSAEVPADLVGLLGAMGEGVRLFRLLVASGNRYPRGRQTMEHIIGERIARLLRPELDLPDHDPADAWESLSPAERVEVRFATGGLVSTAAFWLDEELGDADATRAVAQGIWDCLRRVALPAPASTITPIRHPDRSTP